MGEMGLTTEEGPQNLSVLCLRWAQVYGRDRGPSVVTRGSGSNAEEVIAGDQALSADTVWTKALRQRSVRLFRPSPSPLPAIRLLPASLGRSGACGYHCPQQGSAPSFLLPRDVL